MRLAMNLTETELIHIIRENTPEEAARAILRLIVQAKEETGSVRSEARRL